MAKICIAFLGVLFVGLLVWANIQQRPELNPALTEGTEEADVTLSQILFMQTRNGAKDWELKAQEAKLDKNQIAFLTEIFVAMSTGPGGFVTLRGDEGMIDLNQNRFSLRGGKKPVFVEWGNDYTIETASLGWSSDTRTLVTSDPVKILGGGITVTGTGMSLSSDHSEVTIHDVHAELY